MWRHTLHYGWLQWQLPLYDSFGGCMAAHTKRSLRLGGWRNATKMEKKLHGPFSHIHQVLEGVVRECHSDEES